MKATPDRSSENDHISKENRSLDLGKAPMGAPVFRVSEEIAEGGSLGWSNFPPLPHIVVSRYG